MLVISVVLGMDFKLLGLSNLIFFVFLKVFIILRKFSGFFRNLVFFVLGYLKKVYFFKMEFFLGRIR